ncbi:MAG: tetratricopeptide repeat protein [Bacteroidales bacterium]|nr:tetratricopeptide repeat protein [Bacteroidales bacterium]
MRICLLLFLLVSNFSSFGLSNKEKDSQRIEDANNVFFSRVSFDRNDIHLIDSLYNQSIEINYSQGQLMSLLNMNRYYLTFEKYDSAFYANTICLELANSTSNKYLKYYTYEVSGYLFLSVLDYAKAYQYLHMALNGFEELKKEDNLLNIYTALGVLSYRLNKKEEAKSYHIQCLEKYKEKNDKAGMAKAYNNIACIHSLDNEAERDTALNYFNKALELNKEIKNFNWVAQNYQNIGAIYLEIDSLDLSIRFSFKALQIADSLLNNEVKTRALKIIGLVYYQQEEYEEASRYYMEALKISESSPELQETTGELYNYIHQNFKSLGDYKQSLEYYMKSRDLNDSLYRAKNTKELHQMELKNEYDKIIFVKELKEKKRLIIFLFISIIFLIVFYLGIRLFSIQKKKIIKSRIEKENLEKELESKNHELTGYVLNMMHVKEKNVKLVKQILDQKHLLQEENQKMVNQIVKELEQDQFKNILDEFEIRFSQVHKDFYTVLLKKFPDLSASEKRLCAFLKLDMTTKEISQITGQTQRALEMARSRVKKKLDIANTSVSFLQFFNELE